VFAVVLTAVLAVPSLLPKVSASYDGLNSQQVPSFKVSNDGLLGWNNVSAVCRFVKVDYFDPTINSENNVRAFPATLDKMAPGNTALVICPPAVEINGPKIRAASLNIEVKFRPDFSLFQKVFDIPFVSEGDLSHWTPPHLY
jgi:hypothetical protein